MVFSLEIQCTVMYKLYVKINVISGMISDAFDYIIITIIVIIIIIRGWAFQDFQHFRILFPADMFALLMTLLILMWMTRVECLCVCGGAGCCLGTCVRFIFFITLCTFSGKNDSIYIDIYRYLYRYRFVLIVIE